MAVTTFNSAPLPSFESLRDRVNRLAELDSAAFNQVGYDLATFAVNSGQLGSTYRSELPTLSARHNFEQDYRNGDYLTSADTNFPTTVEIGRLAVDDILG